MTRRDARRVVIIVFRPGSRNRHPCRSILRGGTSGKRGVQCGKYIAAEQSGLHLLIPTQNREVDGCGGICGERNRTRNQSAVIAPVEAYPRACLPRLILSMRSLVKSLVMVNAEDTAGS